MSDHTASVQSGVPLAYGTPLPRNRAASVASWLAVCTVALLPILFSPMLAPFFIVVWPLCIFSAASAVGAGVLGVRNAKEPGAPGRLHAGLPGADAGLHGLDVLDAPREGQVLMPCP